MKENGNQPELPLPATDIREGWTSASNARADGLCEGRHLAQRGLPELPKDDGATTGTAIHEALAKRDPSALSEDSLQTYERCLEIEDKAVKQFFEQEGDNLMTIAEERFWVIIDKGIRHSGQADRIYRSRTKALLLEYKTLPGDHPAASANEQLRDQVCLVHGSLLVNTIGCVTVQPLVTMSPEICTYNAEQIKVAAALMFDRVRASNQVGSRRTAGENQCKWCRAKFQCLEYQKFAASQVPVMASFVDYPPEGWSPEQCGVFLERIGTAEKWLKDCKDYIRARIERNELPGWKIGEGDRKFEVLNMVELARRCEVLGIMFDHLLAICSPNKEELTKLMRAATGTKGRGLQQEVAKLLDGIVGDERKRGSIERIPPTRKEVAA